MSTEDPGGYPAPAEEASIEASAPLPSLPTRIVQTFFSPGVLGEALARNPAWVGALLVGGVLILLQTLAIPMEVWESSMREAFLARGQEVPEGMAAGVSFMRISAVVAGFVMYFVMAFLFAGIVTVIFSFVMGDEGKYRQYLAIMGHAWLIPALVGLALLPLKISQQNPQFTLNLGAFLFFLPEGYLTRVATMLDLSQLWAWLVVAQGAHAIDSRRSFGSAAAMLLVLFLGFAMLFALIPGVG